MKRYKVKSSKKMTELVFSQDKVTNFWLPEKKQKTQQLTKPSQISIFEREKNNPE